MSATKTKTDYVRARVTPDLKANTQAIFESIGLSTSDAIVLFLKQVERQNKIPFELVADEAPQAETPESSPSEQRQPVDFMARLKRMYDDRMVEGDAVGELLKERHSERLF